MRNLVYYFINGVFNLMFIAICFKYMFISVFECDIFGSLLWSILFSFEVDSFIDRQRNFVLYYPNFESKWINWF